MAENMMNSEHLTSTKESRERWDAIKWSKDSKSYVDAKKCRGNAQLRDAEELKSNNSGFICKGRKLGNRNIHLRLEDK